MAKFSKFGFPTHLGIESMPILGNWPMPVVRYIGANTPEGVRLQHELQSQIANFQLSQREVFLSGITQVMRTTRTYPTHTFTYEMYNRQETVLVELFPHGRPTKRPERPTKWLLLEYLWDRVSSAEPVFFAYHVYWIDWDRVAVDLAPEPGLPFGPGVEILGTRYFNTISPSIGHLIPGYAASIGKPGRFEAVVQNTDDPIARSIGAYNTGTRYTASGFSNEQPTETPQAPITNLNEDQFYKGQRETNASTLYNWTEFVGEGGGDAGAALIGDGVGQNAAGTDQATTTVDRMTRLRQYPLSKKARALYSNDAVEYGGVDYRGTKQVVSVYVNLDAFRERYGDILQLRCHAWWRSPRNSELFGNGRYPTSGTLENVFVDDDFAGLSEIVTGPIPPGGTPDPTEWTHTFRAPAYPAAVSLWATIVDGPQFATDDLTTAYNGFEDYMFNYFTSAPRPQNYYEATQILVDNKVITAAETVNGEPSLPSVLPHGEVLGTVTLNIGKGELAFRRDK